MPLSGLDLAIFIAVLIGLPIAVIWLNRRKSPAGWWLLGAVVALLVVGNILEQALR